jgi:hypothetical protein
VGHSSSFVNEIIRFAYRRVNLARGWPVRFFMIAIRRVMRRDLRVTAGSRIDESPL